MNTVLSSTPFPVPAFGGTDSNATPAEFLEFLRSLITQYLGDACPRIPAANKAAWITIVDGLTDHFLGPFPSPDIVSWNTMQEKVEVTAMTLEVIGRVFRRVECIYNGSEQLVRKLFARLLDLCKVLDIWIDSKICGETTLSSYNMKQKALALLTLILRGLGDNCPSPSDKSDLSWGVLRAILKECIDVCYDLLVPSISLTSGTTVALFRTPRIIEFEPQDDLEIVS
ncbi:hypothetical protein B0H34DRAFT_248869 [Crassisporium funariophilum]|nr:hypothetical protein B0H34DRAFT_248869 [Crassisporium funariophilum]